MAEESKIVTLRSVTTEREAALIAAKLEEYGIHCTTEGEYTAGFRAETPGRVDVLVNEKDLLRAQELLESVDAGDSEVDWSQIDVGDPRDSEIE